MQAARPAPAHSSENHDFIDTADGLELGNIDGHGGEPFAGAPPGSPGPADIEFDDLGRDSSSGGVENTQSAEPSAATRKRAGSIPDLPAPVVGGASRSRSQSTRGEPAARSPGATATRGPAPRRAVRGADPDRDSLDLPAPKHGHSRGDDLPAPKHGHSRGDDLLAPKHGAPLGDDLLAPKHGAPLGDDLLAPKGGFFAESTALPSNALDRGSDGQEGGFFDDIPEPEANAHIPDLPAPKNAAPAAPGVSPGWAHDDEGLDIGDLGRDARPGAGRSSPAAPTDSSVSLGDLDLGGPGLAGSADRDGLDLGTPDVDLGSLEIDAIPQDEPGSPSDPSTHQTMDFGNLELAEPSSTPLTPDVMPMGLGLPDRPVNSKYGKDAPARREQHARPPQPPASSRDQRPAWAAAAPPAPAAVDTSDGLDFGLSDSSGSSGLELGGPSALGHASALDDLGTPGLELDGPRPTAPHPPADMAGGASSAGGAGDDDLDTSDMDLGLELGLPLPSVGPAAEPAKPTAAAAGPGAPAATSSAGSMEMDLPSLDSDGDDLGLGLELPSAGKGSGGATIAGGADNARGGAAGPGFNELDLPGGDSAAAPGLVSFNKASGKQAKGATAVPETAKETKKQARPTLLGRLRQQESNEPIVVDQAALAEVAQQHRGTVASSIREQRVVTERKRNKRTLVAVAVLLVVGTAAGGLYGYSRWQQQEALATQVRAGMDTARKQILSDRPGHWERAAKTAEDVLALDPSNADALGLAAQGFYAAYLDDGTQASTRIAAGNRHLAVISERSAKGPDVEKAHALKLITERRPDEAIDRLNGVLDVNASDADALLYLGWAQAAANRHQKAADAFQDAVTAAPGRTLAALYGLGMAHLALGQRDEAGKAFAAILEEQNDHLGAQLGVTEAAELDFSEREKRFLAIVSRDDLDKADPRAVSRAWLLAGKQALRAGRLDEAKTRFDKARSVYAENIEARIGQAKVALARDRLDQADTLMQEVLAAEPAHVDGVLTAIELALRQDKLDHADQMVKQLLGREQSISNQLERARVHLFYGRILERRAETSDGPMDEVVAAYQQARELAGDEDVQPAVALAGLLTRLGRGEDAQATLAPVEAKAGNDAGLAVTLGLIYARANALDRAEIWFRKALEMKPGDIEAQYQLGLVLRQQGRTPEALNALAQAFQADQARVDIGSELAYMYEAVGRDSDAGAVYGKLIDAPSASLAVLGRAGRFFARTGKFQQAGKLGERILSEQANNPAGLYLRGESAYQAGDYEPALRDFREALIAESTTQYLEAQGRAAEKLRMYDEALKAYIQANAMDKNILITRVGEARVRIARRDFDKALAVLEEARKLAPEDARIYFGMGQAYHEQGKLKDAVKHYERSLRYDDRNAMAHYLLGQAFFDLDNQRKAARSLTRATRLAPKDAPWLMEAYLNLGYAERSLSHRREAIGAWESYLDSNPTNEAEIKEVKKLLARLKAR